MTEIESLVAGFRSDIALAVGQHRRIVGAGNVGNFCKSMDFHRHDMARSSKACVIKASKAPRLTRLRPKSRS